MIESAFIVLFINDCGIFVTTFENQYFN